MCPRGSAARLGCSPEPKLTWRASWSGISLSCGGSLHTSAVPGFASESSVWSEVPGAKERRQVIAGLRAEETDRRHLKKCFCICLKSKGSSLAIFLEQRKWSRSSDFHPGSALSRRASAHLPPLQVDSDQSRGQAAVAGSQQSCQDQREGHCPQEASPLRAAGPGITVMLWMSLNKQLQNARQVMGTTWSQILWGWGCVREEK